PAEWGNLEKDPSRFAIVKIKKSEFNEEWLKPEYDLDKPILKDGKETGEYEIKTMRKYRLSLENFLSETEINNLKSIEYNSLSDWSFKKTVDDITEKIEIVDYENRPEDVKLHGSSGNFTICPSGCNYTSLSAWEAGEQADLTGTGPCIAEITEGFSDTTGLVITGWTTTVDDYIKIYTSGSARHDGKWDTSAYKLEIDGGSAFGQSIYISHSNVKIDGLQVSHNGTFFSNNCIESEVAATTGIEISNCIIISPDNGAGIYLNYPGVTAKIWNTIIYVNGTPGSSSEGIYSDSALTVDIYNCVLYNLYDAIERDLGTVTVTNTVVFNSNYDFDGTMTVTYSASDDVQAGTGNINPSDWSAIFENYTAYDFHLKSTNTDLQGAGTDNPGSGLYSDDIDGEARTSTWDIGADEYVANKSEDVPYALSTVGGGQFLIMVGGTAHLVNSTTDINDNEWHHVVGTYDGTTMKIYIDGNLEDTNTDFSGNLSTNDGNVRIGADYQATPDNFFKGTIDEVLIWNRALSPEEINASYNVGLYRLEINYTDLEEGSYTYIAYVQDLAGNLNQTGTRTVTIDTIDP
ncbi:MAG: LamG domain-containing protein, partial [Candidatus Aenigmarchaeota archaeon]|nr:LamG domain-containing protein [Candidatus Aenigmarchaeota archaeon]